MKKLFLALILMAGVSLAQTNGLSVGAGTIWTDSLGYQSGDEAGEAADSVWILDTKFSKSWYRIFVEGDAYSEADSFYYQHGTIRYSQSGAAVDTMWGSWGTVKDSVWNDINVMINNVVGKDFLLFSPIHQLLRFTLLNHRGNEDERNVVITIQAVR